MRVRALLGHEALLERILRLPIRWSRERFTYWLLQDYPFVEGLFRFQAGLLREAPQAHRLALIEALRATAEELDWLLSQGADPRAPVHPVRRAYVELLAEMEGLPVSPSGSNSYPVRTVLHYVMQRVFLEAWVAHAGSEETLEVAQHWTAPEFQAVLYDLEVMAEGALEVASRREHREAKGPLLDRYVARVLEMEYLSWRLLAD
ncbi:hypothetical protein [Thermus filiformis]|uniref:Uncharacterized protein n=1 Tax=Thermus filiformis TaxID=276 RepID=A0A0A2WSQ4_THEFI|nr:hypothetical protein [Thermus filiformis]KGQ21787.1 hypothetical protein THFILI_06335 [Thermus filiformis]